MLNTKYQIPNTIFIIGPTASGKSALAMDLAKKLNGELICADSRTVYRGLDISTAKPTVKDQSKVVHWGLDLIEPNQRFSAADFKAYALERIADIQNRGKLPIIVGGTGLYIDGLLFDFKFGPAQDVKHRQKLEELSIGQLQTMITDKKIEMPENNKNKRYLIRAIEQGGINKQKSKPLKNTLVVGLLPDRELLDKRITDRAQGMLKNGAIKEAQWLFDKYGYNVPAASAPFFKAFAPHFNSSQSIKECLERFVLNDRQLSKRQITWFKRNQHVNWFADTKDAYNFVSSKLLY